MRHGMGYFGARGLRGRRLVLVTGIFFLLLPKMVIAEGINGTMDLTYSRLTSVSTDATGASSSQEIRSFFQLYNLSLSKNILPLLRLDAGGTFQKADADTITDGSRATSTSTLTRPYVNLTLDNPVFSLGAGYDRVTTENTTSGVRAPALLTDTYHGFLGWRPSELPQVDLSLIRSHNYDEDRSSRDVFTDQVSLASHYAPFKTVDLRYQGGTLDTRDQISGMETKILSNSGRITYSDRFLHDRVQFSSYYDVGYNTTEITSKGTGTVDFKQFAFDGLFAASISPDTVQLASAPFLVDNDLNGTNNNAINIGSAPFTSPPPQDTSPRNIGLRFGAATEINKLLLWVNSGTNTLPATVAGSFSWGVYISPDGKNWSLYQAAAAAPYQPYPALPGVGSFEISFPNVKTQYVKVVVSPLPAVGDGVLFPVVAVTELQAFIQKPAGEVAGKTTGMTQQLTVYTKVGILDNPNLFYDFSYFLFDAKSAGATERRSTMSNGLGLSHRFNPVLSGLARAERVDDMQAAGNTVTYNYSASLMATPLPTLRDSLAYSYSIRETQSGRTDTNSLYSTNTAELYKGVTAFLNAGLTFATTETDQRAKASTYSYGLGLAPLKTLNINLTASDEESTLSGGGVAESTSTTRRRDAGVAYTPFSTLYLTAGISTTTQGALHDRTKSYGVNWSPFPGGALQFNFAYSEGTSSLDNSTTKITQPSVRWIISRWASASASYISTEGTSNFGRSTTRAVSVNFRALL